MSEAVFLCEIIVKMVQGCREILTVETFIYFLSSVELQVFHIALNFRISNHLNIQIFLLNMIYKSKIK